MCSLTTVVLLLSKLLLFFMNLNCTMIHRLFICGKIHMGGILWLVVENLEIVFPLFNFLQNSNVSAVEQITKRFVVEDEKGANTTCSFSSSITWCRRGIRNIVTEIFKIVISANQYINVTCTSSQKNWFSWSLAGSLCRNSGGRLRFESTVL